MRRHRNHNRLDADQVRHLATVVNRAQTQGIDCITTDLRHLTPNQLAILASYDDTPDSSFPQTLSRAIRANKTPGLDHSG